MPTGNDTNRPTTAPDVTDTVRQQAETTVKGAQRVFDTYVDVTMASIKRSQEIAEKGYKAWTDALGGGTNVPSFGLPTADIREIVSNGFDLAQGVLDAQRELANQFVDAFAPARS